MACNSCESHFQGAQTIVVSVVKSGTNALLYVQNRGRNVVHLRRILLCRTLGNRMTTFYLRPPPDGISWSYPRAFLEPGLPQLFYTWSSVPTGSIVQAQAEYVEIEARGRSCPTTM